MTRNLVWYARACRVSVHWWNLRPAASVRACGRLCGAWLRCSDAHMCVYMRVCARVFVRVCMRLCAFVCVLMYVPAISWCSRNTCRESQDHGPFNSWGRVPYLINFPNGTLSQGIKPAFDESSFNFIVAGGGANGGALDHDDGSSFYKDHDSFFVYGGHSACVARRDRGGSLEAH